MPTTPPQIVTSLPPVTGVSRRRFLRGAGLAALSIASALGGGYVGGDFVSRWYGNLQAAPDVPRMGVAMPPTTVTTADGVRIHHIQTGFVAVKRVHRSYDGPDGQGILAIATTRAWTEWLPITAWVIEHPEGVIVVDTGEEAAVNNPDYFACDPMNGFFYQSFLRFTVTPEEEMVAQMNALGIPPAQTRWVVQTHLHGDHVHGLRHFKGAEVLVSPVDYPVSQGATPCLYPDWLNPTLVHFQPQDLPGFNSGYALTRAGDVLIVPTPGHSGGHQSVLLRASDRSYLLAGDTSFDEAQLLAQGVAGIASDPVASRQTLKSILTYCAAQPTVYLPAHDHETAARLAAGQTVVI